MINLSATLSGVIEGLAVADAYARLDENIAYWDAITGMAFDRANNSFNMQIAAAAASGTRLKHMFEWGTNGINRQATNMRPQPMEERARLWEAIFINQGPKGGATVDFEFKPSIAIVPVSTMVPQNVRRMMRPHVFEWKARVMEEGEVVHIKRDSAQFLLIPYNPSLSGFKPFDKKRGYTLTTKEITARPGKYVAGSFTAYFNRYWGGGKAQGIMERALIKELDVDFVPLMVEANAITGGPTVKTDVIADVRARSSAIQKAVAAKAKARRIHV